MGLNLLIKKFSFLLKWFKYLINTKATSAIHSSAAYSILFIILYRYASLYFCCSIEQEDNELLTLEIIHRYVELLDKYFGSVSGYLSKNILKILCSDSNAY